MESDQIETLASRLVNSLEAVARADRLSTTALRDLAERDEELAEGIAALSNRIEAVHRRGRLIYLMKAAMLTTTCLRCGSEFASEPGPALCGPCWCELGKPDRYLEAVQPKGDQPHD